MSWRDYCYGTVRVRYIDVLPWQGPRHERLRRIWKAVRQWQDHFWVNPGQCYRIEVEPFLNRGKLSHADCLQEIWEREFQIAAAPYKQYLVITEMDFLPTLAGWLRRALAELQGSFMLAPLKQRANAGDTETWFNMVDWRMYPPNLKPLRWHHERDPGADLHEQVPAAMLRHYKGRLGAGGEHDHMGWEYPWGVHLLGSRHLQDPPGIPLWDHRGKVILTEDLQENHDQAVTRWIAEQPKPFQELLK